MFIVLCIHAIPWCIDCEFPNPWGHVWDWRDGVLSTCLLAAPFLAGLLALRQGWLVPVSTVLSLLVTQLFGGVPLWSLVANEGTLHCHTGLSEYDGLFRDRARGSNDRSSCAANKRPMEDGGGSASVAAA